SERQLPICSKRRLDAIAKTVNQIAKTQKLPAKHINQGFFDPSNYDSHGTAFGCAGIAKDAF
ncbi:hypothetical protein, partial [Novacetimonas maltaceti]|uniref:hypothetical protein n=1 Tax=Novacetimonas maltaceti TaxID=1203393 RepID=UPI001CA4CF34